jgi:hypothetical protein
MRRGLSIFMVLFFGLWPLTGMLEASDESRLLACCRRHGAHHCAMAMQMAAMTASGSTPMLTAPPTCPSFPGFAAGPCTPRHALAAVVESLPVLMARAHSATRSRGDARVRPIRTHAGRGPPASILS